MAITTAQIHAAADQIDKEGKRPTLAGVRTVLGGGSFSTIQEAMKSWSSKGDDEEATAEPVPGEVCDEAERFTAALWQLAEKHAAAAFEVERGSHQAKCSQASAELSDAIQAADEQSGRAERLQNELDEAKETIRQQAIQIKIQLEDVKHHVAEHEKAEAISAERAKTIKTLEQLLNKKNGQPKPAAKAPKLKPAAEIFATK